MTSSVVDSFGKKSPIRLKCTKRGKDYVFDYRKELYNNGLDIVLSYAFDETSESHSAIKAPYTIFLASIGRKKASAFYLLFVAIAGEFITLGLSLWYYSIRGRSMNTLNEKILVHTVSAFSLIVMVSGIVSITTFVWVNVTLQNKIHEEISTFGFSYHLGKYWFPCFRLMVALSIISSFVWTGIEWCITDIPTANQNLAAGKQSQLKFQRGVFANIDEPGEETD